MKNSTQGRSVLYSTQLIVIRGGPGFDPLGLTFILRDNLWEHKIVVLTPKKIERFFFVVSLIGVVNLVQSFHGGGGEPKNVETF